MNTRKELRVLTLAATLSFVDVKFTNWLIAAFCEGVYVEGMLFLVVLLFL